MEEGKAETVYQEQLEIAVIALYADRRSSTKSLLHVSHVCIGPLPFLLSIAWNGGICKLFPNALQV